MICRTTLLLCLVFAMLRQTAFGIDRDLRDEPDSVYLFSYSTNKNNNHTGLQFAWSRDRENWLSIGNGFGYLQSDYGAWGSEKRMITPYLMQGSDGAWQCIWSLNERDRVFCTRIIGRSGRLGQR